MTDLFRRTALLLRTVGHLKPEQVAHRARLRTQRFAAHRAPRLAAHMLARPVVAAPGWPSDFTPIDARVGDCFPDAESNASGLFCFLGTSRALGSPPDWGQADADRLWRFHLHYLEWAWSFVAHEDREWARQEFSRLWESWWASSPPGIGDPWSPYVASLRAWVLCGVHHALIAGSDTEAAFLSSLGAHARFIRSHLELDVGGNHLLKNIKALLGLGVFLDDAALEEKGRRLLDRELRVQVLPDGGHYERSPSYHCQVLGDLLDIRDLLAAADRVVPAGLDDAVASMRRWLGAMLMPDGDVPLFNDCVAVGVPRLLELGAVPAPVGAAIVLEPSGYVIARVGSRMHVVVDVGWPCPPELPAHAHADCLSFELAVDGRRVVVDTGTSTYEAGPRRRHERSTAAHNTVEIDGADQSEVWGVFRAGRLARPRLEAVREEGGAVLILASHGGYMRLPGRPRHRRTWRVTSDALTITDEVEGTGVHTLRSRLHLIDPVEGDGNVEVHADGTPLRVERAQVAQGFGRVADARVVVAEVTAALPTRVELTLAVGTNEAVG